MKLTLSLPLPPTTNNLYATVRGKRVLSARGRTYHLIAVDLARAAAERQAWAAAPDARLDIDITLCWPDKRRHDLDNASKCLLDGITTALGIDDSKIDVLCLRRGPVDKSDPCAVVVITVISIPAPRLHLLLEASARDTDREAA